MSSEPVLRDASSVVLVIHGVGSHAGHKIVQSARRGFDASDLARGSDSEASSLSVMPQGRDSPWEQQGYLRFDRAGESHVVLPCVWSGTRIGHQAAFAVLLVSLFYSLLVVGVVVVNRALLEIGFTLLGALALAVVLDVCNRKFSLTRAVLAFGAAWYAVRYSYEHSLLAPGIILFALSAAFAYPAVRSAWFARDTLWKSLIVACVVAVSGLIVALGVWLGAAASEVVRPVLAGESAVGLWRSIFVLVTPMLACALLALAVLLVGMPLELLHDITRWVGLPAKRDRVTKELATLIEDVLTHAPRARVHIVSHSLGTVLAAQALITHGCSRPVGLFTLGSPLRFMSHVFPRAVDSPESLRKRLAGAGRLLFWENLWRDRDPIGRALNAGGDTFDEHSLGVGGHANYWADPRTWHAIARRLLGRNEPHPAVRAESLLSRRGLVLLVAVVAVALPLAVGACALAWPNVFVRVDSSLLLATEPRPEPHAAIEGRVVLGDTEEAAAGIRLKFGLASTATAADGSFRFSELSASSKFLAVIDDENFRRGGRYYFHAPAKRLVTTAAGETTRGLVLRLAPCVPVVIEFRSRAHAARTRFGEFVALGGGAYLLRCTDPSRDLEYEVLPGGEIGVVAAAELEPGQEVVVVRD